MPLPHDLDHTTPCPLLSHAWLDSPLSPRLSICNTLIDSLDIVPEQQITHHSSRSHVHPQPRSNWQALIIVLVILIPHRPRAVHVRAMRLDMQPRARVRRIDGIRR